MIVLPWPGETACTAPSAMATSSEAKTTAGLRSLASMMPASSAPMPPGTAAAGDATMAGPPAEPPASGCASGAVHGATVAPADGDGKVDGANVERLGQQVLRIAGQPLRDARQVAIENDLAPANSFRERVIGERDREGATTSSGRQGGGVLAHQAHRRQPAGPGRE